jgi:hypothetical protein
LGTNGKGVGEIEVGGNAHDNCGRTFLPIGIAEQARNGTRRVDGVCAIVRNCWSVSLRTSMTVAANSSSLVRRIIFRGTDTR